MSPGPPLQPSEQLLAFEVAGNAFAAAVAQVREIQPAVAVTPIPDPPPCCEGVFNLRGTMVPVFNLRDRLSLSEKQSRLSDNFIIVQEGRALAAFRVDAATEVVLPLEMLSQDEVVLERLAGAVLGAFRLDDKLVPVINLVQLLGEWERALMDDCSKDQHS